MILWFTSWTWPVIFRTKPSHGIWPDQCQKNISTTEMWEAGRQESSRAREGQTLGNGWAVAGRVTSKAAPRLCSWQPGQDVMVSVQNCLFGLAQWPPASAIMGTKRLCRHKKRLEKSMEKATKGYFAHRKHLGLRSPQTTILLML